MAMATTSSPAAHTLMMRMRLVAEGPEVGVEEGRVGGEGEEVEGVRVVEGPVGAEKEGTDHKLVC